MRPPANPWVVTHLFRVRLRHWPLTTDWDWPSTRGASPRVDNWRSDCRTSRLRRRPRFGSNSCTGRECTSQIGRLRVDGFQLREPIPYVSVPRGKGGRSAGVPMVTGYLRGPATAATDPGGDKKSWVAVRPLRRRRPVPPQCGTASPSLGLRVVLSAHGGAGAHMRTSTAGTSLEMCHTNDDRGTFPELGDWTDGHLLSAKAPCGEETAGSTSNKACKLLCANAVGR